MSTNRRTALKGKYMVRLTLLVSGLVAAGIAAAILLAPELFYASYGIEVAGNATLVNELKAPAGALLVAGLFMFAGVVRPALARVSLATASVVYLSYGVARLSSIAMDGFPNSALVSAAGIEIGIGAACLLALLHARSHNTFNLPTRRTQ